ncbi:Uncharacterised protein [Pseudomonas aeruginosa]|nr:Uncharacterised protein [Pseudomonas aeruginosa]
MPVGATPAPGAGSLRRLRDSRVAQHGETQAEAETGIGRQFQAGYLVAAHLLRQTRRQQRRAALAKDFQKAQHVAGAADHPRPAGRIGRRFESPTRLEANADAVLERRHGLPPGHSARAWPVADVDRRQSARVGAEEAAVAHAGWNPDPLPQRFRQRPPVDPLHQRAEHVGGQRIAPGAAGFVEQGHGGQATEILGQVETRQVHAIGNPGAGIGAVCVGFEEAIAEAGAVAQQLPRRDARLAAVGQARTERRQPVGDRLIEGQPALVHQAQGRDADDRLAHRGQAEQAVLAHYPAGFAVGQAGSPSIEPLPPVCHQHHRPHQALVGECRLDHLIDIFRQAAAWLSFETGHAGLSADEGCGQAKSAAKAEKDG